MMQLPTNRSQIWFKVLDAHGKPIDGSREVWSLPEGVAKGKPLDFSQQFALQQKEGRWKPLPPKFGTWLVSHPKPIYHHTKQHRLFVAEILSLPTHEIEGMIWVSNVRLVREATNLDVKRFGMHRAYCFPPD